MVRKGLVSYHLNLIMDSIGIRDANKQLLINGALTLFNLVTNLFFRFLVDNWGRRPIMLVSSAGILVSFVVWTALSARYDAHARSSLGSGVLGMIFIYYLFYNLKSVPHTTYLTYLLVANVFQIGSDSKLHNRNPSIFHTRQGLLDHVICHVHRAVFQPIRKPHRT
jgi:MFS family permease